MLHQADPHLPSAKARGLWAAVALSLLLAACAEAPKTAPLPRVEVPPAPPPPPPPPIPLAIPLPPPSRPDPTPADRATAQKTALSAVDMLAAGNEEQATEELKRALELDPANKLALSLMRQATEDPVTLYGRESFAYVLRPGESLSQIAGRFMGDIYAFYGLARYNGIKVPRQVAGGQSIRVPGKPSATATTTVPGTAGTRPSPPASPPPTSTATSPASPDPAPRPEPEPAAASAPPDPGPSPAVKAFRSAEGFEKAGEFDNALADYKTAASLGYPGADAKVQAVSARLVDINSRAARAALARQDLNGSIRAWDRVLELSPGNENARLERQKVLRLKEKLGDK